jgi:hypothetical protein
MKINEKYLDKSKEVNWSLFSNMDFAPLFLILLSEITNFLSILFCIKEDPILSAASSPNSLSCNIKVCRLSLDKIIFAKTNPPSPWKLFLLKEPSDIPN